MKSIAELLNLRYKYETFMLSLEIPENRKSGCINNIKWFKENGYINNRFRPGFNESTSIADVILGEYYKRE